MRDRTATTTRAPCSLLPPDIGVGEGATKAVYYTVFGAPAWTVRLPAPSKWGGSPVDIHSGAFGKAGPPIHRRWTGTYATFGGGRTKLPCGPRGGECDPKPPLGLEAFAWKRGVWPPEACTELRHGVLFTCFESSPRSERGGMHGWDDFHILWQCLHIDMLKQELCPPAPRL
jgi:hypothetical protein